MSNFTPADPTYAIPKITGVCAANGQPLTPAAVFYAVLLDPPPEERPPVPEGTDADKAKLLMTGFLRRDVSKEAWESGFRPPHLFSYWKSEVPEPGKKKRLLVDDTTLTQMLRDLAGEQEPSRLAFRYMIALILMRKKLLRLERIDRPAKGQAGLDRWVFTPKEDPSKGHFGRWKEDEKLEVADPGLSERDAGLVLEHLTDILGDDYLNKAASAPVA